MVTNFIFLTLSCLTEKHTEILYKYKSQKTNMIKLQINNKIIVRTSIPFRLLLDLGKVSLHVPHHHCLGRLDTLHDGLLVNGSHLDLRASSTITEPIISNRFWKKRNFRVKLNFLKSFLPFCFTLFEPPVGPVVVPVT